MSNQYPNQDPHRSHPGPPIPDGPGPNQQYQHQPYPQAAPQNQEPVQNNAPEQKKGGALKIIGIIAAVLVALAVIAVIALAVAGGGDDDNNGDEKNDGQGGGEVSTEQGNYKEFDCAVQGDDMVSKLPEALKQAEEDGKPEEFLEAMKIVAFYAHNQQMSEEMSTTMLSSQSSNYSALEDYSEEDFEEVLEALDLDYDAEVAAMAAELNGCLDMDEGAIAKYFEDSSYYSDYDESFISEAIGGDKARPTAQTLVAAPKDLPEEYTKALEEGEKQVKNQRLTRPQLFTILYSDLQSESTQAETFSVDAAMYAAEHVTGEFFSDKEVGSPVEVDERSVGMNINSLVDRGYTVPEMTKRLAYKG